MWNRGHSSGSLPAVSAIAHGFGALRTPTSVTVADVTEVGVVPDVTRTVSERVLHMVDAGSFEPADAAAISAALELHEDGAVPSFF